MPNKNTPRGKSVKANATESVTLSALAERVKRRLADKSLDDNKIKQVINSFFDTVRRDILDNGSFKLLGFGTFDRMLVDEKERTDRITGETTFTPGHYKIKFVPVSALAKRVNKPYEHLQAEVIEEAPVEETKPEPNETSVDPAAEALRDAFDEIDDSDIDQSQTDARRFDFSSAASVPQKELRGDRSYAAVPGQSFRNGVPNSLRAPAASESAGYAPQFTHHAAADSYAPRSGQYAAPDPYAEDMSRVPVSPVYDDAQTLPKRGGRPAVENQTVRHAVIQQQIIEQQIVQQHVIQNRHADELPETEDDIYDPDYDGDDYSEGQRYISRCWFFAGIAVVLTALMIAALAYVLTHRTPKASGKPVREMPKTVAPEPKTVVTEAAPEIRTVSLRIAADDNLYAALAQAEYGERNLWPYIFSANMLRYPDPDNPGAARELVVPSKPDRAIDRRDIELSVIDVYDSYRSLIAANPRGRTAAIRKEHAVISLICGESLYGGFIDKYAIRLDAEDVSAAREQIKNAAR
ncbi:HU family DNA-binding protein [Treponema socranskii]|uniref:HU family DNA-binding protein n=1 Tax=Treponema socranskii TaxID=53419 RepID=UPI003D8D387D